MMPRRRPCWPDATGSRSRATPWPPRFAITPRRRWTCRTASPVISPSFARPPAYPPRSMLDSIPLSATAAALLAQGTVGIEAIVAGGDDYEILCAVPENRFAAFANAAASGRRGGDHHRHDHRRGGSSKVLGRARQGNRAAARVLQPFLAFLRKAARLDAKTCRNRWIFALRGVAPGLRFWHGPADLGPPFWAGQASFLCACRLPR